MSAAESFLQAIRQVPQDDAPRLIFADWLEEHGDPRGPFVRSQCQRVRLRDHDPRAAALLDEETRLLKRHAAVWLGPLHQRGLAWEFRRGLLHVRVDVETFLSIDWPALTETQTWDWIESVHVRFRGRVGVRALAGSPTLAVFSALDLSWNGLGDDGVEALLASPHLKQLRSLDLSFNGIGPRGAALLAASAPLENLTALRLDDNRLGDQGAAALARVPSILLRHAGVSDDLINRLEAATHALPLAALHLRWNDIGLDGAAALARSPCLPNLVSLQLSDNRVGDVGATRLAAATGLPKLARLGLESNGVGAAAAAALRRRFGERVAV
jgi:uncharacterized protein (TIGR02996 family)